MSAVTIVFENNNQLKPAFYIGQPISGFVKLSLKEPKSFASLEVQIIGEASVNWRAFTILPGWRGHKYKYYLARESIKDKENFLHRTVPIFNKRIDLLPGDHDFKFCFDLPSEISPSFKGKHGKVTYSIEAVFSSETSPETLTSGKNPFDCFYGQYPAHKFVFTASPTFEASKTFNKCFKKSQPLRVVVGMPLTSFLSGEDVTVQIHIDNESGIKVKRVIIDLVEVTRYKSVQKPSAQKDLSEIILTEDFFKKAIQENDNLEATIKLPYLNPIFLSKIINVAYEFHVILKTSNLQSFPKIVIPLNVDVLI